MREVFYRVDIQNPETKEWFMETWFQFKTLTEAENLVFERRNSKRLFDIHNPKVFRIVEVDSKLVKTFDFANEQIVSEF